MTCEEFPGGRDTAMTSVLHLLHPHTVRPSALRLSAQWTDDTGVRCQVEESDLLGSERAASSPDARQTVGSPTRARQAADSDPSGASDSHRSVSLRNREITARRGEAFQSEVILLPDGADVEKVMCEVLFKSSSMLNIWFESAAANIFTIC